MNCLDSSFIIDYWQGESYAKEFLTESDDGVGLPTVALFELYTGALLSDADTEDVATVADDLDWAEPLPFDDGAAREAAYIEADLTERGQKINAADVLIAGTARAQNATLVATDTDFQKIDGLRVRNPRES
jgi:predicted nucleic acid-binding protein